MEDVQDENTEKVRKLLNAIVSFLDAYAQIEDFLCKPVNFFGAIPPVIVVEAVKKHELPLLGIEIDTALDKAKYLLHKNSQLDFNVTPEYLLNLRRCVTRIYADTNSVIFCFEDIISLGLDKKAEKKEIQKSISSEFQLKKILSQEGKIRRMESAACLYGAINNLKLRELAGQDQPVTHDKSDDRVSADTPIPQDKQPAKKTVATMRIQDSDREKARRLISAIDNFLDDYEKVEKEIYEEIILTGGQISENFMYDNMIHINRKSPFRSFRDSINEINTPLEGVRLYLYKVLGSSNADVFIKNVKRYIIDISEDIRKIDALYDLGGYCHAKELQPVEIDRNIDVISPDRRLYRMSVAADLAKAIDDLGLRELAEQSTKGEANEPKDDKPSRIISNLNIHFSEEDRLLFLDIATDIKAEPDKYRHAGEWLDWLCFGENEFWKAREIELRTCDCISSPTFHLNDDPVFKGKYKERKSELESMLKEKATPKYEDRLRDGWEVILGNFTFDNFLDKNGAHVALLIAWLITDADADKANLGITNFENWQWSFLESGDMWNARSSSQRSFLRPSYRDPFNEEDHFKICMRLFRSAAVWLKHNDKHAISSDGATRQLAPIQVNADREIGSDDNDDIVTNKNKKEYHKYLIEIANKVYRLVSEKRVLEYFQDQINVFCQKNEAFENEYMQLEKTAEKNPELYDYESWTTKVDPATGKKERTPPLTYKMKNPPAGYEGYVWYNGFWGEPTKTPNLMEFLVNPLCRDIPLVVYWNQDNATKVNEDDKLLCSYALLVSIHDVFTECPIYTKNTYKGNWSGHNSWIQSLRMEYSSENNFDMVKSFFPLNEFKARIARAFDDVKADLAKMKPKENGTASVTKEQTETTGSGGKPRTNNLKPIYERAYQSFKLAETKNDSNITDENAYKWLKENPQEDYNLPAYKTWERYVREGRKFYGDNKNQPRAGRALRGGNATDDPDILKQVSNQFNKSD